MENRVDRFVILVDAAYLFAAAGELCYGTSSRADLVLDPEAATRALSDICARHSGQDRLRTYWYDGAPQTGPTRDQLEIADQKGVKLRLGRMTTQGQKGVDSRIVRDLIVLPRNGAVSTIYLMSGDEDVREGVVEAQELGVSVILIGVEPSLPFQHNQAATLVREADDLITLTRSECSVFLKGAGTVSHVAPVFPGPHSEAERDWGYEDFGFAFGQAQKNNMGASDVTQILENHPMIPPNLDSALLQAAADRIGEHDIDQTDRHDLRRGFWRGLREDGPETPETPTAPEAPEKPEAPAAPETPETATEDRLPSTISQENP